MVDPRRSDSREDDDEETKPRVKRETLKDLDPADQSNEVKGGGTTPADECENASA